MKNKEETGHGDNYARCRSVAGDMGSGGGISAHLRSEIE